MENNIEIFENYLFDKLAPEEKAAFDKRLKTDKSFANDFRIYLITVKGIHQEAKMENIEFGYALKHISKAQLMEIIGHEPKRSAWKFTRLRERWAWAASIAIILTIGFITLFNIKRSDEHNVDNILVAYNYVSSPSRDGTETLDILTLSDKELKSSLPAIRNAYDVSSPEDIQECEVNGMQLAMAYLKLHDREKAKEVLKDLAIRFSDDEVFAAQCNSILNQLE